MKYFFGCTFMNREELQNIGVKYPIKLEYYKTQTNEEDVKNVNDIKYGIEVIKTSYIEEKVNIEKTCIPEIIKDEAKIESMFNILKEHTVTPISAEYIIEDLLKEA